MTSIVAVDVGGTHARFALAEVADGRVVSLSDEVVLKTAEHASLETAWASFAAGLDGPAPRDASIAFAGPVGGEMLTLTNSPWVVRPSLLPERLGLDRLLLVNDFGAVAHAVAHLGADQFVHVCGPEQPLPADGVVSIVGPGTGLGVAILHRHGSNYHAIETEGGHVDFAPLDTIDDNILRAVREKHRRASVERIASGPGLRIIHAELARIENKPAFTGDDASLWGLALSGQDPLAVAALDRFCRSLGSIAGDYALAHGAHAVVIAGGLGLRLVDHLVRSGFAERFVAKGRFERHMSAIPVKALKHPQPGLFGAAAFFAQTHTR